MNKNYKTQSATRFGQTITYVYDLDGNYVGRTFKIDTDRSDPFKWVCEIGSNFINDCQYGLAKSYSVRTKAEAIANIVAVISGVAA